MLEDWRGGGGHIRPYIGGGTGGAELGDQRRIVRGRLRHAVIARASAIISRLFVSHLVLAAKLLI